MKDESRRGFLPSASSPLQVLSSAPTCSPILSFRLLAFFHPSSFIVITLRAISRGLESSFLIMATIREQQQAHERRELIRSIILRVCHAARVGGNGLGVSLGLIERGLQRDGMHILLEEIEAEVGYLVGKGWIETVRKENTPANRRWRITAAGVDQAEAEGF